MGNVRDSPACPNSFYTLTIKLWKYEKTFLDINGKYFNLFKRAIMINEKLVCEVKNLTNKVMRVPSLDGKQNVKKKWTFECLKKDAEALIRMYSWYFDIVDTKTVNVKDWMEVNVKEDEKWDVIPEWKEISAEEQMKDAVRETYKKELWVDTVPNNKKNDIVRMKKKIAEVMEAK